MRNISEIIKEIGPGWNLGNSLESEKLKHIGEIQLQPKK